MVDYCNLGGFTAWKFPIRHQNLKEKLLSISLFATGEKVKNKSVQAVILS